MSEEKTESPIDKVDGLQLESIDDKIKVKHDDKSKQKHKLEENIDKPNGRTNNNETGNCYCGKERNLNIIELLCASCSRWFHESCIGYQLGKLVPFMMNYIFMCKNCSPTGLESFKKIKHHFHKCV